MDDNVSPLRHRLTDEDRAAAQAERQRRREEAARRKAAWLAKIEGAKVRAGELPAELTRAIGYGVSGLMLTKLMNGELQPESAKEAAEIARIAAQIAREEAKLDTAGADPDEMKADREARVARAERIAAELRERAAAAKADAAARGQIEAEPDEWDLDDESHAGGVA